MSKKKGFSIEQHDQLGLELQTIQDRMAQIIEDLSYHYPVTSKAISRAKKVASVVNELRSELDNLVTKEQAHNKDLNPLTIYYRGTRKDRVKNPQPIRPFPQAPK